MPPWRPWRVKTRSATWNLLRVREGPTRGVAPSGASPADLGGREVRGRAVLFATGWSRHWDTEAYFSGHPFLTAALAEHLVEAGAALVGIDSLNIDDTDDKTRPVHTSLLGAGIPVVEHLTGLEQVGDGRPFRFFAVPVKVAGMAFRRRKLLKKVSSRGARSGEHVFARREHVFGVTLDPRNPGVGGAHPHGSPSPHDG